MSTVAEIINIMEIIAPPDLAESWDNCGLQVGHKLWPVNKIQVALDPLVEVVDKAIEAQVDLLITHHPLILKPLKIIDLQTAQGSVISKALNHQLSIYAAHTNLDSAKGGVNDLLCDQLKLKNLRPLIMNEGETGLGRIGRLEHPLTLADYARQIQNSFSLDFVKVAGRPDLLIESAAVCSGSGSGLLDHFLSSKAQVFISGDLKYHDARIIEEADLALIDIGHFTSEHLIVANLSCRLKKILKQRNLKIKVEPCSIEKDPFYFINKDNTSKGHNMEISGV